MQKFIQELSTKRSRRKLLKRASALLCAFVMLFTIHTLKRNADTLERIPMCGYAEHEHDPSCYDGDALICGQEAHVHTDACYQQRPDAEAIAAFEEDEIDLPVAEEPVPEEVEWNLGADDAAPETARMAPESTAPVAFALGNEAMLSRIIEVMEINVRLEDIIEVGAVENDEAHTGLIAVERAEEDFRVRTRKDFVEAELALITADDILIVALADGVATEEEAAPATVIETEENEEEQADEEAVPATVIEENEEEQAEEESEPEPETVPEENKEQTEEESESEPETVTEENKEQTEEESEPEPETEENKEQTEEESESEPESVIKENEEQTEEESGSEPESVTEENEEEQTEEEEAEPEPAAVIKENEEQTEEESESEPETVTEENEEQAEREEAEPEPAAVIKENEEQTEEESGSEPESVTEENEEEQTEEEESESEPETVTEENEEEQTEEESEPEPVTEEIEEEQAEGEESEPVPDAGEEQADEAEEDGEDQPEDAPAIAMPAQEFEGRTDYVRISVSAPEGAFPEGTTMTVVDVEDEKTLTDIEDTVSEDFVAIKRVHAVDITFFDADGNEIEPLVPIAVVMTVDEIEKQQDAVVVHVDGEGTAEVVESQSDAPAGETELKVEMPATEAPVDAAQTQPEDAFAEDTEPEPEDEPEAETETELTAEAEPEPEAEPEAEDEPEPEDEPETVTEPEAEAESVAFTADSFSVYAVVVTETIETKFIDAGGETWNISVGFTKEANIPVGATLEVSEVEDESYLADAEAALEGGQRVTMARFFDIRIMNGGEEVQPERPVSVSITLDNSGIEAIDAADDHVVDSGETSVCAVHFDGEAPQVVAASENEDAVVFDAPGFSVWGVLYTVDFYYGNYEYHLTGEGNMTLSALFEVLGIEADAALAQQVVFTDNELVGVVKVEEDASLSQVVAQVKAPEEEAEIDLEADGIDGADEAQDEDEILPAGTWLLVSLAPFNTEEKLTVTMEDGTVYEIRVEDNAAYPYHIRVSNKNRGYISGGDNAINNGRSKQYFNNRVVAFDANAWDNNYNIVATPINSWNERVVFWLDQDGNIIASKRNNDSLTLESQTLNSIRSETTFIAYFVPQGQTLTVVKPAANGTVAATSGQLRAAYEDWTTYPKYCFTENNTTLKATPNSGYLFKGWYADGACVSTNSEINVNEIGRDIVLEPVFERLYVYNVITNEKGNWNVGYFTVRQGQTSTYTNYTEYYNGTTTAVANTGKTAFYSPIPATAQANYEFKYWLKDDGTDPVTRSNNELRGTNGASTYNMLDRDTTYIAWFAPAGQHIVRVNWAEPNGCGAYTSSSNNMYPRTVKVTTNNNKEFLYYYTNDVQFIHADNCNGYVFLGWYNNYDPATGTGSLVSTDQTFSFSNVTGNLNLTPVYEATLENRDYYNVWFDGSNGLGNVTGSNTYYTQVYGAGGNYARVGATSVRQEVKKNAATINLPTTAVLPQGVEKTHLTLQGWYDIKKKVLYQPGDPVTIDQDSVFYASWFADNYSFSKPENTVAAANTDGFIRTTMYDINNLYNMKALELVDDQSVLNRVENRERWRLQSGNFIFIGAFTTDGSTSDPYGRENDLANQDREVDTIDGYYGAYITPGLFSRSPFCHESDVGVRKLGSGKNLYLFNSENGYYYYDSSQNAASYNQDAGAFYVYNYTNKTNKYGSTSDFLPLNYGSGEYVEKDAQPNYWFGMKSEIDFFLPNNVNGNVNNSDENRVNISKTKSLDMVYKFSGDDDVWVFVDGALYLDLGGIHGKAYGEINFSRGTITIAHSKAKAIVDENGIMSYEKDGGVVETKTFSLEEGDHTLTLCYLERGASQSNCAIYFNLAPRYALQFHKVDASDNTNLGGATFGVYTDPECTVAANVWGTYTGARTNIFTTGDSGYVHCSGLVAGKTYYIKELSAPAGYPDVSEEVITLQLDAYGNPTVSSTADSTGTSAWRMAEVRSSEADGSTEKGTFMLYMTVKNRKETNISAQKIWAMIDGSQYSRDEDCSVKVKLQRYSLTAGDGQDEEQKYNVRLIQRFFADGDKPTNRDTAGTLVYDINTQEVSKGGSITFTATAGNGAGVASVTSQHGIVTSSNTTGTGSQHFYMNGGWSEATQSGTYTLSNVQSDTDIYITYIGSTDKAEYLGMAISGISKIDGKGTRYVRSEDAAFNVQEQVNGQAMQVTLNKGNNWKTTWTNLATVGDGTQYYYYVKEISNSSELSGNPLLSEIPAYVTTYSSDGLSGGGTISVRNTLQAIKVKLRKRDGTDKGNLQGVGFKIYTKNEYEAQGFVEGSDSVIETNASIWLENNTYDSGKKLFVSDNDGRFYTGYLPLGTYYIVEMEKPVGYGELAGAVKIEVTENGLRYQLPGENDLHLRRIDSEGYYNLYIDNAKKHDTLDIPASVTFDKQDNGGNALDGATFTLYSDAQLTQVVTTYTGGSFTVSTGDVVAGEGETATTLGDLLGEAASKTFYLKETAAPAGYLIGSPKDVYEIIVGKTVTDTEVLNTDLDAYVTTTTFSMSVKKGEKTQASPITVVNTPIEIEVVKVIKGTTTPLPGAEFTVVRINDDGTPALGANSEPVYSERKRVDEHGKVTFSALPVGRYKLDETKVPDGYIKAQGECRFTVAENGTISLDQAKVVNEMIGLDGHVFTVQNEQGVTLPSTGGSGTAVYCVVGATLTLLALALLLRKRARGEIE